MGFAIKNDGTGWRAVDSQQDCLADEHFSSEQPALVSPDMAVDVRLARDGLIQSFQWRFDRYASQVRLGIAPRDDITALDAYVQALREVPEQLGFPHDISWPVIP